VALGVAITTYPHTVAKVGGVLGSDMWFYGQRLRVVMSATNPFLALEADRGLFFILFAITNLTHMEVKQVLILAPALCSALLATSAFALVKEGTGRPWLAGLAALLSYMVGRPS